MIRRILLSLAAFVLFFGLFSLVTFWAHLNPPASVSQQTPGAIGLVFEEIELHTEDGLKLAGWFIPRQADGAELTHASTLVVLHGWPEDKGSVLRGAVPLLDQFNLLLFDFRALGRSEGRHSTLGAREAKDVQAALSWLEASGHTEIGVWGFSMGGAVALMTAGQDPRIRAVVTDTSFARLDIMARDVFHIPLLGHGLALGMRAWSGLFLGIDIRRVAPVEAAAQLKTPSLIIHLKHDHLVPFDHALMLESALADHPNAEFWFRDQGFYGQVSAEYLERLRGFFDEHLGAEMLPGAGLP